jgi:hypothetical protein
MFLKDRIALIDGTQHDCSSLFALTRSAQNQRM